MMKPMRRGRPPTSGVCVLGIIVIAGICISFLLSLYLSVLLHSTSTIDSVDGVKSPREMELELRTLRQKLETMEKVLKAVQTKEEQFEKRILEKSFANKKKKENVHSKSAGVVRRGGVAPTTQSDQHQSPAQQLESFMVDNPNSPGSRFVALLRKHLHAERGAEAVRLEACYKRQYALCMGGVQNYREATGNKDEPNSDELEQKTRLVLWPEKYPDHNVYNVRRYHDNHEVIPFLATQAACLPLMLAGYAIQDPDSIVVELGPYVGLSSRCIVTGMAKNGDGGGEYHAFDTFEDYKNYHKIMKQAPWLNESHPEFTEDNTSFLFLWEHGIRPVYPRAKATAGFIDETTLNMEVLGQKKMAMISIDSAKNAWSLKSQTAGLGTFEAGTIMFLMDFERIDQLVKYVYPCLRERFLLPVYASWTMEHWAFVVTKDFSLQDPSLQQCYMDTYENQEGAYKKLDKMVEADLNFLVALDNENPKPSETWERTKVKKKLTRKLHEKPFEFKKIAHLYM